MSVVINMCRLVVSLRSWNNKNRRGTKLNAGKLSTWVLNSYLDPIGDQNDVQQLSTYFVYLAYLVCYCFCLGYLSYLLR